MKEAELDALRALIARAAEALDAFGNFEDLSRGDCVDAILCVHLDGVISHGMTLDDFRTARTLAADLRKAGEGS